MIRVNFYVRKLTQLQKIYTAMMCCNTVTRLLAFELFGCQSITARMSELRMLGVHFSQSTGSNRITQYWMSDADRENNQQHFPNIYKIKA